MLFFLERSILVVIYKWIEAASSSDAVIILANSSDAIIFAFVSARTNLTLFARVYKYQFILFLPQKVYTFLSLIIRAEYRIH